MAFTGSGVIELSEDNIFKKISEYDIFRCYILEFIELNKVFSSPLRKDIHPSCSIQEWQGTLFYKDFSTNETYTAIKFVMKKFNVDYYSALTIISNDFNLNLHTIHFDKSISEYIGIPNLIIRSVPKETVIKIKRRPWNKTIDKQYWSKYGLNTSILTYFNVFPLKCYWINEIVFKTKDSNPSYAYILNTGIYKILSPYSSDYKWLNNANSDYLQGYNQLPETGELLIITSSLKDVMLLYKYGYIAIAPSSETTLVSIEMIEELKERFTEIIVFFDNDKPGIEAGRLYESLYEINMIYIPNNLPKDLSDYYYEYGYEQTKQLLKTLL